MRLHTTPAGPGVAEAPDVLSSPDPRAQDDDEPLGGHDSRLRPTIRGFIAFDLSASVRAEIGSLIGRLSESPAARAAGVRWSIPEDLHVTLKFLGRVETAVLPDIRLALMSTVASWQPLHLFLEGAGSFPEAGPPRLLCLRVGGEIELLSNLAAAVENRLFLLGFPLENRAFSPHLTLGRITGQGGLELTESVTTIAKDLRMELPARELGFFRSDALATNARHPAVFRVTLGGLVRS